MSYRLIKSCIKRNCDFYNTFTYNACDLLIPKKYNYCENTRFKKIILNRCKNLNCPRNAYSNSLQEDGCFNIMYMHKCNNFYSYEIKLLYE